MFHFPTRGYPLPISNRHPPGVALIAIDRVKASDGITEIYEDETKLSRAIQGYEWLLQEFPQEFTIIDASRSVAEVTTEILSVLFS
jgi:thymidylate kinase